MSFAVDALAYDRFMGRYSSPLAPLLADFAGVATGQVALDVGCGPGALTGELVERLGPTRVSAVDPSGRFVTAARERYPDVNIYQSSAEELPFDDRAFDVVLAQLVVHFLKDPLTGINEMRRVVRPGGTIAACVWDHSGRMGPLAGFWQAARDLTPDIGDESQLAGTKEGQLGELFDQAGLKSIVDGYLFVDVEHPSFDEWWEPFTLSVGPAGTHVAGLGTEERERLRKRCHEIYPDAPFVVNARAWVARGLG